MQLPATLLHSLQEIKGFDRESFEEVHSSKEQVTSVRINPAKPVYPSVHFSNINSRIPWSNYGYYLEQRPSFTFDPLFHAGCYYVQEASSMFLEQAMIQITDLTRPLRVLDLCAAPGGKSTHIQSLLSKDSLLVSNEVIRSRSNVLKDNIVKWGCENVVVTNNDPKDFERLKNYFDVIVVDAPCSGSGLFRKEQEAIAEWNENNVQLCSQRQQRILADVLPALKKNGILIYSTCSYSREEDEDIVQWLLNEFPLQSISLSIKTDWNIIKSNNGYRFWPDKVKGEGFFLACFQKMEGEIYSTAKSKSTTEQISNQERAIISKWMKTEGLTFVKNKNTVYAWPEHLKYEFDLLLNKLKVVYSGILCGDIMRDKLIPDHALALSKYSADSVGRIDFVLQDAVKFLQRKEFPLNAEVKGWQLVTYQNHHLGWVNILHNRVNNYYPKELRIFKEF